jgi:predicted AlkP superfamily pyrophosphatase or phosphodiesterase
MTYRTSLRLLLLICLLLFASLLAPAQASTSPLGAPSNERVLIFVSDGMRHDLMKGLVAEGKMPTYAQILESGVEGENGMIPNVPSNSGPGWTALMTGASPATNGVTNNTFHDNTLPFSPFGVSAWSPGVNQAETLAEAAEAAGLSVMALGWQTFDAANITNGVVMDPYPDWLTGRGIVANYEVPLQWTHILSTGPYLSNTVVTLEDAEGWTNVPPSYSPAQEAPLALLSFAGTPVLYHLYLFDSTDDATTNYDHVLVAPAKDGAEQVAILGAGEWSDSIRAVVDESEGGFYVKVIDLAPDLSQFRLYFTQITRARVWPQSVEDYIVANFDAIRPIDFSPYILGLIDAQTFTEQIIHNADLLGGQIHPYLIRTFEPDLVLAGNEATDAIQHRFLSLALPGSEQYDPVTGPTYWSYIEQAYSGADSVARALWDEMPDAHIFVTSDHGFHNTGMAINANYVLQTLGLYDPANLAGSQAVAYWAGGTAQVYINLQGRNPGGVVAPEDYEPMRAQIVEVFTNLGPEVIRQVLLKEETDTIPTAMGVTWNMLHPDRTGDVVVFSEPPYQFDAATAGQATAPTPIYGQHGFLPDGGPEGFAAFAAAGPHIQEGVVVSPVTAIDLAPTAAAILGIAPPAQSEGRILPILHEPSSVTHATLDAQPAPAQSYRLWLLLALAAPATAALAWRRTRD